MAGEIGRDRSLVGIGDRVVARGFAARHGLTAKQAAVVAEIAIQSGSDQMSGESVGRACGVHGTYVRQLMGKEKIQRALVELAGVDVLLNLGPLMRKGIEKALSGSHPHWHDVMEMAGFLKGGGGSVNVNVGGGAGDDLRGRVKELEGLLRGEVGGGDGDGDVIEAGASDFRESGGDDEGDS